MIRQDIFENSGMSEAIKIIRSHNARVAKANKQKKIAFAEKLVSGVDYRLNFTYLKVQENGLKASEISLEGWENASNIFAIYKKIGFDLGVNTMTLMLNDKKVKRLKFNY